MLHPLQPKCRGSVLEHVAVKSVLPTFHNDFSRIIGVQRIREDHVSQRHLTATSRADTRHRNAMCGLLVDELASDRLSTTRHILPRRPPGRAPRLGPIGDLVGEPEPAQGFEVGAHGQGAR